MDANDLRSRLSVILGADCLLTDDAALEPFLTDHRKLYRGRTPAVALPRTVEQISRLLSFCNDNRVAVVPHGGNTSYCGGATPDESGGDLVLSLRRLSRIRNVDARNWSLTAEAGCILADVQRAADQVDRFFPLSLGSEGSCQIGGNLSTNAGGTNVVRYGMMRDQVLGIEVVLPNGRVLSTLNTLRKDNTGYDLKSLFIGAEGTLGVITAASLKLYPKIRTTTTAFVAVPSPQAAVTLLSELRDASGDSVSSFELIPRIGVDLTTKHIPGVADPLDGHFEWYVLCELSSSRYIDTLGAVLEGTLEGALSRGIVQDGLMAQNERHREAFWKLRETIPEAQRLDGASLKHDISVPIAVLPDFVERASKWIATNVPEGRLVCYGHVGDGNLSSRNKKKKKFADYVLQKEKGVPVAVVEAKDNTFTISHGLQQALGYADILEVPCAFSSNGDGFAGHNKAAAAGEDTESEFPLEAFPSPEELWQRYKRFRGIKDEQEELVTQAYYDDGSKKEPHYYQAEAINRVIERVAQGQKRLLLIMATGTGKTYTTFQIIWRLWKAKKVKRVLFLVDRNILADQTLMNDFKPFGAVMTKIKNRKIDPSYEVYLGLYQALTGPAEEDKIFKTVSRDFFDLIVIDECHRGSANDDSTWKEILEYFDGATQLGLTATPKETEYASNITYFGESIYTYSLKQGIQDGFLAPYKVVRIDIDKDIHGWTPPPGMKDDLGNDIEQRQYNQVDMDRILVLNQRTKLVAQRIMKLMNATDPYQKTIVFCEDIDHAERMRKAIVNAAGSLAKENSKYVMRITGDSVEGKAELDNFIDPESRYPVIATTSELLTTGVDAKTCKLIVLDKTINSMTTFKQIVGRGTRIEESQNKYFFTIMDFKRATELFKDPDFDGEPVVIYEPDEDDDPVPPDPKPEKDDDIDGVKEEQAVYKVRVSGVDVRILSERVEYLGEDGQMVTESYRDYSRKNIRKEFASLNDFLQKWNGSKRKAAIIEALAEYGIELPKLAQEVGKDYGDFDLICHIAFDQPPLTRRERANNVKKRNYFTKYGDKARAVLEALLDKYADEGVASIENNNVLKLDPFSKMGTPVEIINGVFGGKANYEQALQALESELFKQAN